MSTSTSRHSVFLPVLFARPSLATVPVLRVVLVPEGGGAPHQSVRRPLEALQQDVWVSTRSVLSHLLPAFDRLDNYTVGYLFPPKDVNQFVDEFPEGYSHLLAVLLGFYALGADYVLGGDEFKGALRGWTATACVGPRGELTSVALLKEKLLAVFDEAEELERIGCGRVRRVIVAAGEKPTVASLIGLPQEKIGPSVAIGLRDGHLVAASEGEAAVEIHFARNFEETLRLVFGTPLLARYRRALGLRGVSRRLLLLAVPAVAVVAALAAYAFGRLRGPVPTSVRVIDSRDVQLFDARGERLWLKTFDGVVAGAALLTNRTGARLAVVGVSRRGSQGGHVVAFDSGGRQVWRFSAGSRTPYERVRTMTMRVNGLLVGDLLDEPGEEAVFIAVGSYYPSRLCILSDQGRLLREMWHPGVLGPLLHVRGTKRLVFSGCNNGVSYEGFEARFGEAPGDREETYVTAVGCIEAEKVGGQCPPYAAPGLPPAPLVWYKLLLPFGRGLDGMLMAEEPCPPGTEVFIVATGHWKFCVDRDGRVLGVEGANNAFGARPRLVEFRPEGGARSR